MDQQEISKNEPTEVKNPTKCNIIIDKTPSVVISELLTSIVNNLCDEQQLSEMRSVDDPSSDNFNVNIARTHNVEDIEASTEKQNENSLTVAEGTQLKLEETTQMCSQQPDNIRFIDNPSTSDLVVNSPSTHRTESVNVFVEASTEKQNENIEAPLNPTESVTKRSNEHLEDLQEEPQKMVSGDNGLPSNLNKVNEATSKTEAVTPKLENDLSGFTDDLHDPPKIMSPEPNCSICLGKMENKSFTNSCFHQFCFTCLLEWSKVKPECPLCKQPFKSIVHNVRSMEDYDQYYLRFENLNSWDSPNGRRFRYRSTLTSERRREISFGRLLRSHSHRYPTDPLDNRLLQNSHPLASTSDYRRFIYEQNLWAQTMRSVRFRECSPTFYSQNPACTHRLIPWINRELNALEYGHQVAFLMELILSLILRFHIQSPEFEELVRPYFLSNTSHFIHEFYSYARSPLDMTEYDRRVTYREGTNVVTSSSADNDVIYLHSTAASSRPRWSRRHLPTSDNSMVNRARDFLQSVSMLSTSTSAASPQPGPSGLQTIVLSTDTSHTGSSGNSSCSHTDISDDDSIEILPQHLVALNASANRGIKREVIIPDEDADDDDCVVIGYEKPLMQRSPMAIIVISDSEDEAASVAENVNGNVSESLTSLPFHDVGASGDISPKASTSTGSSPQRIHLYGDDNDNRSNSSSKLVGHLSSVICRPTKPKKHKNPKRTSSRSRSRRTNESSTSKEFKHHKKHRSRQSRSRTRHDSHLSPSSSKCTTREMKKRKRSSSKSKSTTTMKELKYETLPSVVKQRKVTT